MAVPSPETVRYDLDLNDAMRPSGGPESQGSHGSTAKNMPVYKIRAGKCAIVGATIERQFYRWDGSKWRGNNGQIRNSIPIDLKEMEVNVPMLRRRVILIRERGFFTAETEEGFVCVSVGEVESGTRNGLPLNALVIPGSSRVVIEPDVPTPYRLERRGGPETTRPAPADRDLLPAEALMALRMPGLRGMRGPLYDPQRSHPCPSSGIGPNGGIPPGVAPHRITAPPSGSSECIADQQSNHAQAVPTAFPSSSVTTVGYNHPEPVHSLTVQGPTRVPGYVGGRRNSIRLVARHGSSEYFSVHTDIELTRP